MKQTSIQINNDISVVKTSLELLTTTTKTDSPSSLINGVKIFTELGIVSPDLKGTIVVMTASGLIDGTVSVIATINKLNGIEQIAHMIISGYVSDTDYIISINNNLSRISPIFTGAPGSGTIEDISWAIPNTTLKYAVTNDATAPVDGSYNITKPTTLDNGKYIWVSVDINVSGHTFTDTIAPFKVEITGLKIQISAADVNTELAKITSLTFRGVPGSGTFDAPTYSLAGTNLVYAVTQNPTSTPIYSDAIPTTLSNNKWVWISVEADATHKIIGTLTPKKIETTGISGTIDASNVNDELAKITSLAFSGVPGSGTFIAPTYSLIGTHLIYGASDDINTIPTAMNATIPSLLNNNQYVWISVITAANYTIIGDVIPTKIIISGLVSIISNTDAAAELNKLTSLFFTGAPNSGSFIVPDNNLIGTYFEYGVSADDVNSPLAYTKSAPINLNSNQWVWVRIKAYDGYSIARTAIISKKFQVPILIAKVLDRNNFNNAGYGNNNNNGTYTIDPSVTSIVNGLKLRQKIWNLGAIIFSKNSKLTKIGDDAFTNSDSSYEFTINSAHLPDSLVELGSKVFYSTRPNNLTFGKSLQNIGSNIVPRLGIYSLNLTFPSTLKTIGFGAFADDTSSVLSFGQHSQLQTIGTNAFLKTKIRSLVIPKGVLNIGASAFSNSHLTSLTFERGSQLTTIDTNAFRGSQLTNLTLPSALEHIGVGAFLYSNLTYLKFQGVIPSSSGGRTLTLGANAFQNTPITAIKASEGGTTQQWQDWARTLSGVFMP